MLTNKQKQQLKKLVHADCSTFQIGKSAITENMITDILNYLNKHEIMKISILNNSPLEVEEACLTLQDAGMEIVSVIGRVITVYKHSKKATNPIKLVK